MRHGNTIIPILATIVGASAAVAVPSASAGLPEFLPAATEANPVSFTGISKGKLEIRSEGNTVECEKAKGSGSATSLKLGRFAITLEGCKETTGGTKCTGLSDKTEGTVTIEGEFHSWRGWLINFKHEKILHKAVFVILPKHFHFSCFLGILLFLITGCGAVLWPSINILLFGWGLQWKAGEAGSGTENTNDITLVENEKGELIGCALKAAVNEGKEAESVLAGLFEIKEFKQGGKEVSGLMMA